MPLDIDPEAPDYIDDPYPFFARLLAEAPVLYSESRRFWILSTYEDIRSAIRAPTVFSSAINPAGGLDPLTEGLAPPLLCDDPPRHTVLRRFLRPHFTRSVVAAWEQRVRASAEALISQMKHAFAAGEPVDFVASFASPLPVIVIAELLGIDPLPGYTLQDLAAATAAPDVQPADLSARRRHREALEGTVREVIARRRREPRNDLISAMVHGAGNGQFDLDDESLARLVFVLWSAGNETTTHLLTSVVVLLQRYADVKAALHENHLLIAPFIEEALRWDAPITGLFRRALVDVTLRGHTIRAGEPVWLLFASANHDRDHFAHPEVFDVRRAPNDHLAFGGGVHSCLGMHLARMEATVAIELIMKHIPSLRVDPAAGVRVRHPVLRGYSRLPAAQY